jgi:hypothetical protein
LLRTRSSTLGFSPSYRNAKDNGQSSPYYNETGNGDRVRQQKAVKDYQDYLASVRQEIGRKADGPFVITRPVADGQGRIYLLYRAVLVLADALLVAMGMGDDIVITPDTVWKSFQSQSLACMVELQSTVPHLLYSATNAD